MLCPTCEATRFPDIRTSATTAAQPPAIKKTQPATKRRTVSTSKGADVGKNVKFVTDSKSSQSDDEEDCVFCNETVTVTSNSIRCDVCKHVYHQTCTGLPEEVFTALTTIVSQVGWVCRQCRSHIDSLKCSLAKVNEELADMRVALSGVIAEVNSLKNAPSQPQPSGCNSLKQSTQKYTSKNFKHGNMDEFEPNEDNLVTVSQLRLEFHRAHHDITRRKQNVVVTGLPETRTDDGETDKEADNTAFIKFCEENLSVKPPLAHKGCVRLGKTDGVRPRRLLVHLTSESNAANILSASKALRRSDDIYIAKNVYFNPDLNPIEAQLAYKQREQIRQRRLAAATRQTADNQTMSLNVAAEPYVARSTNPVTASSSVACSIQRGGDSSSHSVTETSTNTRQLPFLQ